MGWTCWRWSYTSPSEAWWRGGTPQRLNSRFRPKVWTRDKGWQNYHQRWRAVEAQMQDSSPEGGELDPAVHGRRCCRKNLLPYMKKVAIKDGTVYSGRDGEGPSLL